MNNTPPPTPSPTRPASAYLSPVASASGEPAQATGIYETHVPITEEAFPYILNLPEGVSCNWWANFAIKITNIVNVINYYASIKYFNYFITGSSAVALLTYFYKPGDLAVLDPPNDCDFIIRFNDGSRLKKNFSSRNIKCIEDYCPSEKNQLDSDSGTFRKINPNTNTFNSIDITFGSGNYLTFGNLQIAELKYLKGTYESVLFKRNNNAKKRGVLENISGVYKPNEIVIKNLNNNNTRQNNSRKNKRSRLNEKKGNNGNKGHKGNNGNTKKRLSFDNL